MGQISELVKEAHENAKDHGWWDSSPTFGEVIALMHSELSEALEDYRNNRLHPYWDCGHVGGNIRCIHEDILCKDCPSAKPCGIPSELADCVIRIMDYCGQAGIDLELAILEKMAYNKTRPYRHGGKKI